ncbi:MAG: phosphoenolpyruvate--protein phosphotransferase [Gammaproteobacteria bacterium]|nr:MAG: phosphoenolpyruvate--protein phosphotransferase [Gammaproteobacteria bacterium]RKZ71911.1 MAG: phosphoenolpyruvate--protein phosphotransferase [Gammaproteobacteria bacterium]
MTIALHGMGVSRGIAIGKAHVVKRDQLDIREYSIKKNRLDDEVKRFEDALTNARQQLRAIREHIPESTSADIEAFIDTHLLMLDDAALTKEPMRLIKELSCNAEWALKLQRDALVAVFDEMDDAYLRTRKDDVDYVVNRIQRLLLNQTPLIHEKADQRLTGYIIMANDLTPADTVLMQHNGIAAFATEFGGPTSHTAILARSLGIPAIVGLQNALRYIKDDEEIILDGSRGIILVDPERHELLHYQHLQKEEKRYFSKLGKLKNKPAITLDEVSIALDANIELPKDFETVVEVGAAGVGLYRTEFLYMNRETPPDEEEHYATYKGVIDVLKGLPLTIRTLDLGADKQVDGGRQSGPVTTNPALGLRAIRLCLKEPALFRPQLRAIIRASVHGPVRILIPMLSNVHEMQQVLQMVDDIKKELDEQNIPYDHELQIGGMIEVPAAAVCADIFAKYLDFLSIGTNDLIQYTMAIDRVNDEVNYLYDPLNPAVLRLVHTTIKAGKKENIPVAMCGEMAGETKYTRLLLGLGLREFSIHPATLLEVKQIIIDSNVSELQTLANKALKASNGIDVANIMRETTD